MKWKVNKKFNFYGYRWHVDLFSLPNLNIQWNYLVWVLILCIGNNLLFKNHFKFWFCQVTSTESHRYKRRRRYQQFYICRLLVLSKHLHVKKISWKQLHWEEGSLSYVEQTFRRPFSGGHYPWEQFSSRQYSFFGIQARSIF